jgi:3-phytase
MTLLCSVNKGFVATLVLAGLSGCMTGGDADRVSYPDDKTVKSIRASAETPPVPSSDDAADDPAIWIHPQDRTKSLVIGTDKKSGMLVYDLEGNQIQFLGDGEPNNVDIRQAVVIDGRVVDIAVTSDRADNSIGLYSVTADGLERLGRVASILPEPYGICMASFNDALQAIVSYKTGELVLYDLAYADQEWSAKTTLLARFDSQLEGCSVDESLGYLYVGEEVRGIWGLHVAHHNGVWMKSEARLLDEIESDSGLVADVEGLDWFVTSSGERMLVVSSQGNDSFAIYSVDALDGVSLNFRGRFRVQEDLAGSGIDGAQETDGLAVTGSNLNAQYPEGLLVIQDGFNAPEGSAQNFKFIDLRELSDFLE